MTRTLVVVLLCGTALGPMLAGCSNLREMAGLQKKSPDEFAVTTKAPLVIPPDFNLRPRRPMRARPATTPSSSRWPMACRCW